MKKIYFMLVLVSVISVLLVSSVYAAGNITVSAEVVEDTVVAEVIVEDNPGIAGYSLLMDFDKSKLVPVSVEQGTAVAGMGVISNVHLVEDLTTLDAVSAVMASTTSMRKNGVMFTVVFDIKDGATGEVELSLYAESENAILNGNLEVVDIDISGTKINLSSGQSSTTGGGSIVIKPSIPNKPIVKPDPEEPEDEPEEEPDDGKPEVPTDK